MPILDGYPKAPAFILGLSQMILAIVAIGLEVGSIYVDFVHGTIWAGFWAGFVFLLSGLVLLLMARCCCRNMYGRVYGLIVMIFGAAVSITFIYFEAYFMNNLCTCYLSNTLCCAIGSVTDFTSGSYTSASSTCSTQLSNNPTSVANLTCPNTPTGKSSYIKAQLATSIFMLITCASYIIIFILQCVGICFT